MTMKCNVISLDGKAAGSVELSGSIYGLEVRDDILSRVIHWQLAKRRQGTHETKERGDVACSTRKIVKQKVLVAHVTVLKARLFLGVAVLLLVHINVHMIILCLKKLKL